MKIGCHAVLFTEAIATDTVNVLSSLHAAGAQGAEIGSRFFGLEKAGELCAALDASSMELSGLHAIAPLLLLLEAPEKVEAQLVGAAQFLQHVPCKNIIATGAIEPQAMSLDNLGDERLTTPEVAKTIAENLNRIATRIKKEYGVQIHYHNHNWEFKNQAVIFNALVNYAPSLCFALDTGWAAVSGYDPVELIRTTCKGRIHYVHLRDYKKEIAAGCETFEQFQNSYVELGEGDMDYAALLGALKEALDENDWAVVEYEKGAVDVKRYEKAVAHVHRVLGGL